jgi:hypothetical protein
MEEDVKTRFEELEKDARSRSKQLDDDVKARFEEFGKVIETRFDELDKRLASNEKRLDDLKWFVGGITGVFALLVGTVTVTANLNFNNEKANIREDSREIRADIHDDWRDFKAQILGQVVKPPQIEICADDGTPLENHDVEADIHKERNSSRLQLNLLFIFRNSGESMSGPLYIKIYASDPIQLFTKSSDEPKFQFEAIHDPEGLHPSQIPDRFSFESQLFMPIRNNERPLPGRYPALIKVYYGGGKVAQADFNLVINPI